MGVERRVDEVGHQRVRRKGVEGQAQGLGALHPHRGRVDDRGRAFEHVAGLRPVVDDDPCAELGADLVGADAGAVGDAQFRYPAFQQRRHHGPRGAAGADHRGGTGARAPVRGVLLEVGDEAVAVGVVGVDAPIGAEDQRVRRPDQRGAVGDDVSKREGGFLVRDGDVAADEAGARQGVQDLAQMFGRDGEGDVVARDPVAAQPVGVQPWRAGVRDRPADHPRQGDRRCGGLRRCRVAGAGIRCGAHRSSAVRLGPILTPGDREWKACGGLWG